MLKIITNTLYGLAILLVVAIAGLFLASMLPIPGNIEIKIVKSGSMKPAIPTGSIVIAKPVSTYSVGDIITFGADTATQIPTTHRIVGINPSTSSGLVTYVTKGDANEEADPREVRGGEIIGKVLLSVPYAGFVLDFAKQPIGFLLLIALPAAVIIIDELLAIAREVRRRWRPKRRRDEGGGSGGADLDDDGSGTRVVLARLYAMDDIFIPIRVLHRRAQEHMAVPLRQYTNILTSLVAAITSVALSFGGIGGTLSYFRDEERSSTNIFGAGTWVTKVIAPPQSITSFSLEEQGEPLVTEEEPEDTQPQEEEEAPEDTQPVEEITPETPPEEMEFPAEEKLPGEEAAEPEAVLPETAPESPPAEPAPATEPPPPADIAPPASTE